MSKKIAFALVLVGVVAACARQEPEEVVVIDEMVPVTQEPIYQGKYGAN